MLSASAIKKIWNTILIAGIVSILAVPLDTHVSEGASQPKKLETLRAMALTRAKNRKRYPEVQYITATQALSLFNAGKILLVDADSEAAFAHHVIGAINIPRHKMKKMKINLKNRDQIIGVYCH